MVERGRIIAANASILFRTRTRVEYQEIQPVWSAYLSSVLASTLIFNALRRADRFADRNEWPTIRRFLCNWENVTYVIITNERGQSGKRCPLLMNRQDLSHMATPMPPSPGPNRASLSKHIWWRSNDTPTSRARALVNGRRGLYRSVAPKFLVDDIRAREG